MIRSKITAGKNQILDEEQIRNTLHEGLSGYLSGQKVLVLIPDHTRSIPMAMLFRELVEILHDAKQLDFLVALGTHPKLVDERINSLVGITEQERSTKFKHIGLLNHAWGDATALVSLGSIEQDEINTMAGDIWHPSLPKKVDIRLNRAALEYDHILILGPTFPHEVAGFSGGAKYLFPGISGPEMIHATHWLGALSGVVNTIGVKDTPVRRMIHSAAEKLKTPVTLAALVVEDHDLAGIFVGDLHESWSMAVDLSAQRHVQWLEKPMKQALSCAPAMYDELWTAAKAMYKVEPAMAVGGRVIIYAPHLETISEVHGNFIFEVGYHILPYFLENWERFKQIPLGVLAHSTHMRGAGRMENGIEIPNLRVALASKISAEDCKRLNLEYIDPRTISMDDWKDREEEGVLFIPRAGEMLYKVKS
ncbi:MAG TPA: lactate racemase domain-containing protein [Anaerolineales bacterium]|nr:lactate racemase domain-containing protein [Anaerolineales bacterium]